MSKNTAKKLFTSLKKAKKILSKLSPRERKNMEKSWDVEHAYYSSALEGSKLDRKDFEKLAEKVQ